MVFVWGETEFKWNSRAYGPTHIYYMFMIHIWFMKKCYWSIVEEQCFHLMCLYAQLCLILCKPIDYSPPGSSVYAIFQARILEWVAICSSRGILPIQGSKLCLLHLLHGRRTLPLNCLRSFHLIVLADWTTL